MNSLNRVAGSLPQVSSPTFRADKQRIDDIASQLEPQDIMAQGKSLGSGSFGKGFQMKIAGETYVAKNFGHSESTVGSLGILSVPECQLMALKQASMHNALAMAGLPIPVAAVLAKDSTWVIMKKVDGVGYEDLNPSEQAKAQTIGDKLQEQIEPILQPAFSELQQKHPDSPIFQSLAIDGLTNMKFAREPDGIRLSGFFDPVI